MADSYQAYGANVPTLPNSNIITTNIPLDSYDPPKRGQLDVVKDGGAEIILREVIMRTPSPTPEEAEELLKTSMFDWKAMRNWRYWVRKEWRWYYIIGVFVIMFIVLFVVYHQDIVDWLQPAANWMHDLPAGWLIPIAIFVIISFPPLFGHEILGVLCGVVWGLGVGFAIVAAGTFLGEMANFYAFRHSCTARGKKYEEKSFRYAYLVKVIRDGGFKVALIARFSIIPGHFLTAVFSTCGMKPWVYAAAAFLSLPKQFLTVYLGVALEQSQTGGPSTSDRIIKAIVITVTILVTLVAMWWITKKMNEIKPDVIYQRRKARQAKLNAVKGSDVSLSTPDLEANTHSVSVWNPGNIPTLHAPQPKRPTRPPSCQSGTKASSPTRPNKREQPYRPVRQDSTSDSDHSWHAPQESGSYTMSTTYTDPATPDDLPSVLVTKPSTNKGQSRSIVSDQMSPRPT